MLFIELIISIVLVSLSYQNITETIFHNRELSYLNIEDLNKDKNLTALFGANDNKHITYPSIHYPNFAFYFSLKLGLKDKEDEKTGANDTTKGVWLWLLQSSVNTTYQVSSPEKEQFYPRYNGIGLKISKHSLIAVSSHNEAINASLFSSVENATYPSKHMYNLTSIGKEQLFIRISLYIKYIYYEISTDGDNFKLWFVEDLIISNSNSLHFELIANLKNEAADYEIRDVYLAQFNKLISKENEKEDLTALYEKVEQMTNLIHGFDAYELLTQQLREYPFEKIIEDNRLQIEQITYINRILSSHLYNNTQDNTTITLNEEQDKFNALMSLIRNVSITKSSMEKNDSMSNAIESLNSLKERQKNLNESIFAMYRIVSKSIDLINAKANKMETYKSFEKILFILIVLSLIMLYSIYNNISGSLPEQPGSKSSSSGKPIASGGHSQIELV